MEMVDHAWDLIVHAELGEGMNLIRARQLFLIEYPDNERIFDEITAEYEEENDTKWDYECPKEKKNDFGDIHEEEE